MRLRRTLAVLAASGAVIAGSVLVNSPAGATGKNGVCESGELCLYYLQNFNPPVFDLFVSDPDFSNDVFPGTHISADNNTESAWNHDVFRWHVFTGANYSGAHGCIPPGASGNFNSTFRNAVSSAYYSSSGC
jgi:hypothetical protein